MGLTQKIVVAVVAASLSSVVAVAAPKRPIDVPVDFQSPLTFDERPWLKEFKWVVVINRATTGSDKQSIRVYDNGHLVTFEGVKWYLNNIDAYQKQTGVKDPNQIDRMERIAELEKKQWSPGVFKVSTGRDAFEPKGEHGGQRDSWTTTPTGYFTPQAFVRRHKSEAYSPKLCDTLAPGDEKTASQKASCIYMENVVFFNGGVGMHKAIPGSEWKLGQKATGGCVRLPAALSEFLYLNLKLATAVQVPMVARDGSVLVDDSNLPLMTAVHRSVWGSLPARSTLIIVQDQVR